MATVRSQFYSRIPAIIRKLPGAMDTGRLEGAETVKELAKRNLEVEHRIRTGDLHDSIEVERTREGNRDLVWVIAGAWYAHFVEFGTVHTGAEREHRAGWAREYAEAHPDKVWRVPPHPFLGPAAEEGRPIVERLAAKHIRDACS